MRVKRLVEQEIEVKAIRLRVPNRYHDEEGDQFLSYPDGAGYDREKHELTLVLDLDTGKVRDWPTGATADIYLKVCDEGFYELLDPEGAVVASRGDCYVPVCLPNEFGDYFVAEIAADGSIAGWHPDASDLVEVFGLAPKWGKR